MSELAFNANGDNFEVPAVVTGWRVRRLKPRGAPELVYGRDGRPLTIPIESDMHDLRDAVGGVLGRYRLDPINDDGKTVDSAPAAYVQVVRAERQAEPSAIVPTPHSESEGVIREAMRLNTELARAVVDRFPEMMTAAAELLRAADGAGLPARPPAARDEDGDGEDTAPTAGFDLNAFVAQIVPMLVMSLSGKLKLPSLDGVLDWRKAAAQSDAPKVDPVKGGSKAVPVAARALPELEPTLPPIDPAMMAHFIAIQSALNPEEAALAREVAGALSAAELHAWIDELSKLSVPQAVQKIRVLVAGNTEAVS